MKEVILGNTHVVSPQRTFCFLVFVCMQFLQLVIIVPPKKKKNMLPTPNFQTPTSTQQSPYAQTHPTQAQLSPPAPPFSHHPHPSPTATPQQPHAPPSNYSSPPQPASVPPTHPPWPYSQTTQQRPSRHPPPQRHSQPHSPHRAQRSAQGATQAEQAAEPEDPYQAAKQQRPAIHARAYVMHARRRAAWRFAALGVRRIGLSRGDGRCVIVRVERCVGVPGVVVRICRCGG